jgi:hypothetical protein
VPCVGGNRLYRMPIERHAGMIAKIEERVSWFWDTIERGEEPNPNFEQDSATITKLYTGMGLDIMVDLRGNERARGLCELYLKAHQIEVEAKNEKQKCMAEIKFMMRGAKSAMIDGYLIKASHVRGGTSVREPHWRFNITKKET